METMTTRDMMDISLDNYHALRNEDRDKLKKCM